MTPHSQHHQVVLVAGATGMLGNRIATQLCNQPDVTLRLLVRNRDAAPMATNALLRDLESRGAAIVPGDVTDPASLAPALEGVDVVVSAVQGGRDVVVDGQIALARAAREQGARRMLPSDVALNLFAATPGEHPAFDLRREADDAIADSGLEHIHVLNGAFLDGMIGMGFDHDARTTSYWGTGDEAFEATTVEDTARYAARAAVDRDLASGPFPVVGQRISPHQLTDEVERVTGQRYSRRCNGSVEDLRDALGDARARGDVTTQTGLAYAVYMTTGQTRLLDPQNSRYPDITPQQFSDVAGPALSRAQPVGHS